MPICVSHLGLFTTPQFVWIRGWQPTARVPNVARGMFFSGMLSELKYSNYNKISE